MRAVLLALLATSAAAQSADDVCAVGDARAELDVAGVRAALYDNGQLFWDGGRAEYEVPRGSGKTALFNMPLWVAGVVDGEVRSAGSAYGMAYWPGPLEPGGTTTAARCAALDRIWTVRTADLEAYDRTDTASTDLAEWPVAWGAPFYTDADGDGRQGPSEPTVSLEPGDAGYGSKALGLEAGERPVVFGRQTAWWVMNDAGGTARWTPAPLGLEVRVTAWAPGDPAEPDLLESTFYRFELVNRGPAAIEDAYAGFYVDADLGEFVDDVVHSDSARSMLVFYNSDEFDDGPEGYGSPPPALGVDLLRGGWAAMNVTNGGTLTSHPMTAVEAYRYLRGYWRDGTPMTLGGIGYDPGSQEITRWAYPGDPVAGAYWSAENVDGAGGRDDYRPYATASARLGTLAPGDRATVDVGVLFARGADRLASVEALRRVSDRVQALYEAGALTALVEEPAAPAAAPTLLEPADGFVLSDARARFAWGGLPDATAYRFQVGLDVTFDSLLVDRLTDSTAVTLALEALPINLTEPLHWRVVGERVGVPGPPSAARTFTGYRFGPAFASFEVVANGAGPLDPPDPGAAAFAGFPTPEGLDPTPRQQTTGTRWLVSTGGRGTYEEFEERALRSGELTGLGGEDLEMRFTGESVALRRFQDGAAVPVPFELWATGLDSPDDPSDDVRLIPVLNDRDLDGTFNLSTPDSPLSSSTDDPETDWVYWYLPADPSPGEAGYLAFATGGPDGGVDVDELGEELLARTTLVGWNLGSAPPYPAALPEPGTVFRIVVSDPLPVAWDEPPVEARLSLEAWPNPARDHVEVAFGLEAAGAVRLRVVDVLGREVATLVDVPRAAGEHRVGLDASRLAAGVYVVVLEAGGERVTRTMTVAR